MSKNKKLCKLCHKNEAVVPDRNYMSMRVAVCIGCHADRLRGDMEAIMARRKQPVLGGLI